VEALQRERNDLLEKTLRLERLLVVHRELPDLRPIYPGTVSKDITQTILMSASRDLLHFSANQDLVFELEKTTANCPQVCIRLRIPVDVNS
jgi:hypothetical protein